MQLENLATRVEAESPHRRYAALHRAIDNGMASDATWRELVDVCLVLGQHDEALRAFRRIDSLQVQRDVEALLTHRGLLDPVKPTAAGPGPADDPSPGLREEAVDAARILLEDHMPLTTLVATLTFPLVVGLGGFLTAGHSFFLFPIIAALPALCVVGLVGALSRTILVDAANGIHDVPRIPGSAVLVRNAGRFLLDGIVLLAALAGPAIAMAAFGLALSTTLAAAAVAALLLPMALLIRQMTNDWRALTPNCLFRAIARTGADYIGRAVVCTILFLPAAAAAVATVGSQLYLQVSVLGPLLVAPLFVTARLLGRLVDTRRAAFTDLLDLPVRVRSRIVTAGATPPAPAARPSAAKTAAAKAPAPKAAPAAPARAATVAPSAPPPARPTPAARTVGTPPPRPKVAPAQSKPTIRHPAPAPRPTAAKAPPAPTPAVRTPKAPRADITTDALPDFTALPGFHVVTGAERVVAGAAATPGSGRHRAQPDPRR